MRTTGWRTSWLIVLIMSTCALMAQSGIQPDIGYNSNLEQILDYNVDITVEKNGKLIVVEKIKVNVKGISIKRGIFRILPSKRHINGSLKNISYKILAVKKNGVNEPYHTTKENGTQVIYFGEESVLLDPGIYEYELSYETQRQIGFFDTYDEIYWNATGNYWDFPILSATVKVHLPEGASILQNACYTGSEGSTSQNCSSNITNENTMVFSATNLKSYEGMTVAVGFPNHIIPRPELPDILKENNLFTLLSAIAGFLAVIMMWLWYRHGVDNEPPTVYPQFDVPENLSPAEMGYIQYGNFKNTFISAAIINLAVKKYITIKEIPKKGLLGKTKFELTRTHVSKSSLSAEESNLLNGLLHSPGDTVTFDGAYNSSIANSVNNFKSEITDKMHKLVRSGGNKKYPWLIFSCVTLLYWTVVITSYFKLYEANKIIVSVVIFIITFILFSICTSVRIGVAKWIWILPAILTVIIFKIIPTDTGLKQFEIAHLFLTISVTGLAFFSYVIRKPTKELLHKKSLIEGFKMYLGAAENHLIKFHNPPKMTPEVFEKYLPYALILGVQDIWGKKLNTMLKENPDQNSYQTSWYVGSNSQSFTTQISSSLSESLSRSISAASTQPSSSGSGGGGSSGGGSSGGGGGGGGGGGW